jgi:hypothetical protein
MKPRRIDRFSVWTHQGSASYRSRSKAIAAARWVAIDTGDSIPVANERTGQRWDVSAVGHVSAPS